MHKDAVEINNNTSCKNNKNKTSKDISCVHNYLNSNRFIIPKNFRL